MNGNLDLAKGVHGSSTSQVKKTRFRVSFFRTKCGCILARAVSCGLCHHFHRNRAVIAHPSSLCYTFFVRGTWPCMTYAIFATSYQISDAKKDCRSRRSRKRSAFRRRQSRNGSAEFHIVKDTTPTIHAYSSKKTPFRTDNNSNCLRREHHE